MLNTPIDAIIEHVREVSIHGQRYYDLTYRVEGDDEGPLQKTRAPYEETYENPSSGDRVRIHSILGAVTRIEKAEE